MICKVAPFCAVAKSSQLLAQNLDNWLVLSFMLGGNFVYVCGNV